MQEWRRAVGGAQQWETLMFTRCLRSLPVLSAGAARHALAAAFTTTACAIVWLPAAHAQSDPPAASSASATDRQNADDRSGNARGDGMSDTARRARTDEQRMLGSPRSPADPYGSDAYSTDGASPAAEEDALTRETRMQIVSPSDFYATGGTAANGLKNGAQGGTRGISRHIGETTATDADAATAKAGAKDATAGGNVWSGYDYGAATTSPTAPVYGNPYSASQRTAAEQLYRSPW